MKFLVTGSRGYIGVHLVDLFKEAGHYVTGCDLNLFTGCEWNPVPACDCDLNQDIRSLTEKDVEGHDAVCHLAAISNDPMGEIDPSITHQVNCEATFQLANLAKNTGIQRFLFSSSCSVYGAGEERPLSEGDELAPLTAYARSKIESEVRLATLADEGFSPVYLRNATAYGASPMFRLDLVVNNLLGAAVAYNEIRIKSDGSPWRPLIHCRDIARAFVALALAPREVTHNQAVNVGGNSDNYRVKDIAEMVRVLVPSADIVYTGEAVNDPRNYRVSFDKFGSIVPDFRLSYDLESGMRELHGEMISRNFSQDDFEGSRYVRLKTLAPRLSMLSRFVYA